MNFDDEYWSDRYNSQQTGWDIGSVSDPLKTYIDQLQNKQISILIPGCGNAWEAAYLHQQGFSDITVIDIAESLVAKISNRFLNTAVKVLHGDFFDHQGSYDLILEQTFFCALDPSQRPGYVLKMKELLRPGGKLAGIFFNCYFNDNPPFGGTREEYLQHFFGHFNILYLDECYNSIPARRNKELFVLLQN